MISDKTSTDKININKLSAQGLVKSYGERTVVNDVCLEINSGEIVGLLGANGAGKTSTFYMIVGLTRPEQGNVTLDEEDITSLPIHERAHLGVGYLPQEASIFRHLNVRQNILAVLELRKNLSKSKCQSLCDNLISEFHLEKVQNTKGISLSGGERRRVEIARALALEPKFILLDEPFAGIDPISIIDIKRIINQLKQKNIGILITDHNVRETLDICGRSYIMHQSEVIASGTPAEILKNETVRNVYLGESFKL